MKTIATALLGLAVAGCTSWPPHGQGGYAEHDYFDGRQGPAPLAQASGLRDQLHVQALTLDVLMLKGANQCVPAYVELALRQKVRAQRALAGGLIDDAENDIVILGRRIDAVAARFDYLARFTHCAPGAVAQTAMGADPAGAVATHATKNAFDAREKILLLLNSHSQFASNQAQLLPQYAQALQFAAQLLVQQPRYRIRITGYTDDVGELNSNALLGRRRAEAVRAALLGYAIAPERVSIESGGEANPIAANDSETGRLANRRVVVSVDYEDCASCQASVAAVPVKKWRDVLPGGVAGTNEDLP
jgi:outer membrane protein OmpA-like peptidoglycan-associated protein